MPTGIPLRVRAASRSSALVAAGGVAGCVVVGAALPPVLSAFGLFKVAWVVMAALAAALALANRRLALVLLFIGLAIPFRSTVAFDVELRTTQVLLAVVVVHLVLLAGQRRLQVPAGLMPPLAAIGAGAVIAAISGPHPGDAFARLGAGIAPAMAAGIAAATLLRARDLPLMALAAGVALVLTCVMAIAQWAGVAPPALAPVFEPGRVNGLFVSPNLLGTYIAASACLTLGLLAATPTPKATKVVLLTGLVLALPALALTQSRGALLALALGLGALSAVFIVRGRLLALGTIVAVLAVGIGVALPQVPTSQRDAYAERVQQLLAPGQQTGRQLIWAEAERVIQQHPVTGVGPLVYGQIASARARYAVFEAPAHAHNVVLEAWLSVGLLGLAGILWLTLAAARRIVVAVVQAPPAWPGEGWLAGTAGALVAIIAQSMVDLPFFQLELLVLFFVLIGTCFGVLSRPPEPG